VTPSNPRLSILGCHILTSTVYVLLAVFPPLLVFIVDSPYISKSKLEILIRCRALPGTIKLDVFGDFTWILLVM